MRRAGTRSPRSHRERLEACRQYHLEQAEQLRQQLEDLDKPSDDVQELGLDGAGQQF